MAKFGVLAIRFATILAAISFSTWVSYHHCICLAARLITVNVRAVIRTANLAASFAQLATPSAACLASIRPAATGCASSTSVSST
jgi:hypothetical protein